MRINDLRPHMVLEHGIGAKTLLGILREKKARAWRRSDFGVISSHLLFLNDQASWVKKIQRDLKVRTKP